MNISNTKTILFFSISALMVNGCVSKHELRTISPQRVVMVAPHLIQPQKSWNRVNKPLAMQKRDTTKSGCINCYAAPIRRVSLSKRGLWGKGRTVKVSSNQYGISNKHTSSIDYSLPPSELKQHLSRDMKKSFENHSYNTNNISATKHYGNYAYTENRSDKIAKVDNYKNQNRYLLPAISTINSSYSSYGTLSNNSTIAIQVGAFREYSGAQRYMQRYSALSNKYRTIIKTGIKNNQPIYRVRVEGFVSDMAAKKFMNNYGINDAFVVIR